MNLGVSHYPDFIISLERNAKVFHELAKKRKKKKRDKDV
jgi:hypothetical protein